MFDTRITQESVQITVPLHDSVKLAELLTLLNSKDAATGVRTSTQSRLAEHGAEAPDQAGSRSHR
jgi:hypothetical protein